MNNTKFINLKTKCETNSMSADELILNLQGKRKCIDLPYFLLQVEGDNISVNNGTSQKIILEKFGSGWSFYLDVFIPDVENSIQSLRIERVSIEVFDKNFWGKRKFSFATIYPINAKTFKDMDFHDSALFRFESL